MSWWIFILLCLQESLRQPLLCCASTESLLGTLCANSVEAGATAAIQQLPGGGGNSISNQSLLFTYFRQRDVSLKQHCPLSPNYNMESITK